MCGAKNKSLQLSHDNKFWNCAARLRRDGHKTIVHALAWESPGAYDYLLGLLSDKIPPERISVLLWSNHINVVKKLENQGYGTFSPSSLRRFRQKYFDTGELPDVTLVASKMLAKAKLSYQLGSQLAQMSESLYKLELRVHPTKIGHKLRKKAYNSLYLAAKLQNRLSKKA